MKNEKILQIIREEISSIMSELSTNAYVQVKDKIKNLEFKDAMKLLYDLIKHNKISSTQFIALKNMLVSKAYSKDNLQTQEGIISEISLRNIKDRIKEILKLQEVEKYKIDEFTYENIPFEIFQVNGILPIHLKQYQQSKDIITYDLGININPIKKNVDVFLQKSGIFG